MGIVCKGHSHLRGAEIELGRLDKLASSFVSEMLFMSESLPPVVLVHGWGGSYEGTWVRTGWVDALERAGRQVVPLNLPGHGRNSASHAPADYGDLAGEVDAALPGHAPLDAVGFSLGGKIVLAIASRRPKRFRRIVIGGLGDNVFAKQVKTALSTELERGFPSEARTRMPAFAAYLDESCNDLLAIAAVNRRPFNPEANAQSLGSIESEILLVNGTDDAIANPCGRLRAALPGAGFLPLPGVDHFSLHHQPVFREHAIEFLNRPGEQA